jgi:hypothetical protein
MKQAILITAYKELDFISNILQYFDDDFDFFIHVDRKCKEDITFLRNDPRVNVYRKYRIEWGGSNHIFAIVLLMQEACKDGKYDYYHLITGSDFPVKPLSYLKNYFELHRHDNYMNYFKLPDNCWGADGGFGRMNYFFLVSNILDIRKTRNLVIRIDRKLRKIHARYLPKRKFKFFNQLYGGSTYWSLSADAVNYAVDYMKNNPQYLRRFRYTLIGEEIFLQTILLNNRDLCINADYLRYMRWDEYGTKPEVLDISDYESLQQLHVFFARKFDKSISKMLIDRIVSNKSES